MYKVILMPLLALVGSIFVFVTNAYAEISYTPAVKVNNSNVLPKIKIYGQIKKEDVQQFHLLKDVAKISAESVGIRGGEQYPLLVELDSLGGSVAAAIAIGKEIREAKPFSVNVQESASCVSACVLVLAGGVSRYVAGRVGIHRPYLDDDKAYTVSSQKKVYAEMEKVVKDYLSFVNVPTSLYDRMFRIPPEKVRFLSDAELQEYNLSEDDPYHKEAQDAVHARKAGITKSEYTKRVTDCNRLKNGDDVYDCFVRVA